MKNKKSENDNDERRETMKITIILGLAALLLVVAGCATDNTGMNGSEDMANNDQETMQGRAVVTITDAAADMGAVSDIEMTIDNVQLHSESEGWVELSGTEQTYNLLELKANNKHELVADEKINTGSYDKVKFDIKSVTVIDDTGRHEAYVPNDEYAFDLQTEVSNEGDTVVMLDIIADESLHTTTNDTYVMAPVTSAEAKTQASAAVRSDGAVNVNGGQTTSSTKVGMDIDGQVGVGLHIPASIKLSVEGLLGTDLSLCSKLVIAGNGAMNDDENLSGDLMGEVSIT